MWRFHGQFLMVTWLCLPSLKRRANVTENRSGLKRNFPSTISLEGVWGSVCVAGRESDVSSLGNRFGGPKGTKNNCTRWATTKLVSNGGITPTWNGGYNSVQLPSYFRPIKKGSLWTPRWQGLRVEADDVGYSCAIASCRDSWEMAMAPCSWRFTKNFEWWIYDLFWQQKNTWKTHLIVYFAWWSFCNLEKLWKHLFVWGGEWVQLCFVFSLKPQNMPRSLLLDIKYTNGVISYKLSYKL